MATKIIDKILIDCCLDNQFYDTSTLFFFPDQLFVFMGTNNKF